MLEADLTEATVYLLAPADSTNTSVQAQTFWWEPVADAEMYNLLIVSPNFKQTQRLVEDTVLYGNRFERSLAPGEYEWGVAAYNSSTTTPFTVYSLKIDTLSSLSNQYVLLVSPEKDYCTNAATVEFGWEELIGASSYLLEVKDDTWSSGDIFIATPPLTVTKYTAPLDEGLYSWVVRAYEESSNSTSQINPREFIIDRTAPGIPVFTSPASHGDTLNTSPYLVSWTHPSESLAPIKDSVFVSSDSMFSNNSQISYAWVEDMEYSVSGLDEGTYFVRVKSIDQAGNKGEFSTIRKFYLDKGK